MMLISVQTVIETKDDIKTDTEKKLIVGTVGIFHLF